MKKLLLWLLLSVNVSAADSFMRAASDTAMTGKKVQTFVNTVGANDVHSQSVNLVNSSGASVTTWPVTGTFWQATQPVSGTFWQATQPVSLASVPSHAVTNAGTFAVQATGTFWQATQPVSIASMPSTPVTGTFWQATQPISGTFWQATQPISGTVTANAGTNLDTSALALDATLANLNVAQAAVSTGKTGPMVQGITSAGAPTWSATEVHPLSLTQAGGLRIDGTGYTQPVSSAGLSNLDVALSTRLKPADTLTGVTTVTNLSQMGGVAISLNTGVRDAGTQRVTIATNDIVPVAQSGSWLVGQSGSWSVGQTGTWNINSITTLPSLAAGTALIGKFGIDQTTPGTTNAVSAAQSGSWLVGQTGTWNIGTVSTVTNLSQLGGTAIAMNTGVRAAGVQRVTIATDDVVPASQSGTWNVTNVSGTVSLPTGAATEASLVKVPLAQGSTTSGQSGTLIQGAVTTDNPTYTTAKTSPISLTTRGEVRIALQQPPTYNASSNFTPAVTVSRDFWNVHGSASKTIYITQITVSGNATATSYAHFTLIKRSAATTGGTSTTQTDIPLDSSDAAGTATVKSYTAVATEGASVGVLQYRSLILPITAATATQFPIEQEIIFDYAVTAGLKPITLRGTAQNIALQPRATLPAGTVLNVSVEWYEL